LFSVSKEIYIYTAKHVRDHEDANMILPANFSESMAEHFQPEQTTCFRLWLYKIAKCVE